MWENVPSGYDYYDCYSLRNGKIYHAIKNGKPSISMGHGLTMAMLVITWG